VRYANHCAPHIRTPHAPSPTLCIPNWHLDCLLYAPCPPRACTIIYRCAVLAFKEWLAPLAAKTGRALVVPQRFAKLFNFSHVAKSWAENCGVKEVIHEPGIFAQDYEGSCAINASTSFHLRIDRDWAPKGGGQALVPCPEKGGGSGKRLPPAPASRNEDEDKNTGEDDGGSGLRRRLGAQGSASAKLPSSSAPPFSGYDRCLLLRGKASLHDLLRLAPELTSATRCFVVTHGARGFRARGTCGGRSDGWNQFDYTDR